MRGGSNDSPPLFVSIIIFLFFCPPRPTALSKVPSSTRGEQRTKMKMEESRDFLTPLPLTPSDIPFQFSARFLRMKGTCPSSFALSPAPGGPKVTEIRRDLGGAAIRRNFEMFARLSLTTCMFCLGRGANDPRRRRRRSDRPKPSILDFVTPKSFLPSFVRPTDPEASLHFSPPHSAPGTDLSLPAS